MTQAFGAQGLRYLIWARNLLLQVVYAFSKLCWDLVLIGTDLEAVTLWLSERMLFYLLDHKQPEKADWVATMGFDAGLCYR